MRVSQAVVMVALVGAAFGVRAEEPATQVALVRIGHPGFVQPGSAVATMCQLTGDKIVVVRSLVFGIETREERALTWSGDVAALVDAAAAAELDESPFPADAPTTTYGAVVTGQGPMRVVELGSTYEGVRRDNPSPEARGLRTFLDAHCPPLR
jgi:hypothetical protein